MFKDRINTSPSSGKLRGRNSLSVPECMIKNVLHIFVKLSQSLMMAVEKIQA